MTAWRIFAAWVGLVALFGVTEAWAHATLVNAEPRDGAMLASAPPEITLTFNEPVAPLVFHLIAPDGRSFTPEAHAENTTVRLRLPEQLGLGTSVLSWRVISADGHPVGGAMQFSIGEMTAAPAPTTVNAGGGVAAAILIARFAIYLGLFIGIGGAVFAAWSRVRLPRNAELVIASCLGVALAAIPFSIGFQGADALDVPLLSFWRPEVCAAGLQTSYGITAVVAGAALLAALVSLLAVPPADRIFAIAAFAAGAVALAASGHASNAPPQLLMRPAVFVHAGAIILWAGSLLPLLALFQKRAPPRPILSRFSRTVPFVIAALAVSGFILAIVQLEAVNALWTTGYGRVLLAKAALLAVLALLAAYNRYTLTPAVLRGRKSARQTFTRTLTAEIACVVAIFALVPLWRITPPPRALAAAESAFVHLHGGRAMADITATPGRAGPVALQVRLLQEDFKPLNARAVKIFVSTAGLEPLERPARQGTSGEWHVDGLVLPVPGIWTVRVEALVDDFTRESLDGPLVIAR